MGLASPSDLQSIEAVEPSAPAKGFWHRLKRFFEPPPQPREAPAVCVPPGAHLILKNIPADLQREWRVERDEGVVFVQTSANVNSHRDAIQFHNGRQVRLQDLNEGLRVEVLSLAGASVADEDLAFHSIVASRR
ncbi:MAG: hypothetical protein DMG59_03285 [Acidobacteria bacterium]|jgi:hypothetical protein|nr:MAG: hypothetical protein DMG59_03285 [Acidobacteriota bacterium]